MEEKKFKYNQDDRIYFDLSDGVHKGWATVCGILGPIVIVKPEIAFEGYPFTHVYVVDNQIVENHE